MPRRIGALIAVVLVLALTACGPVSSSSSSGGSSGGSGGSIGGGSATQPSAGAAAGGISADAAPSARHSVPVTSISKRPSAVTGSNNGDTGAGCAAGLSIQKWDNDKPGNTVTGAAKVVCIEPPLSLSHTLYLEYQSSGDNTDSWNVEENRGVDPQFSYNPEYTFLVGSRCRVGTWRLRYHAEGMGPNRDPILVDFTSPDARIYISKCGPS